MLLGVALAAVLADSIVTVRAHRMRCLGADGDTGSSFVVSTRARA